MPTPVASRPAAAAPRAAGLRRPRRRLIRGALVDDPPAVARHDTPVIRPGFAPDLDELRETAREAKAWIATLETTERERTGIRVLKVGYNKVFGYYLEISQRQPRRHVPDDYLRKQTLVSAERYITPELKEYETSRHRREERIDALEGGDLPRAARSDLASAAPQRAAHVADALAPPRRLRRPGEGRRRAALRPARRSTTASSRRSASRRAAPGGRGGADDGERSASCRTTSTSIGRGDQVVAHHRAEHGRQEHLPAAGRR